ncbi:MULTISPECIES: FHA domain-containing protein [Cyanophyceae]|uniref:FHA domain-containing protein n=1 Tax=Cyanophyceae TaxID=3028117 RepID=UPI00016DC5C5|nr:MULTISPECIES: FHA domain-containing protein [Cyanophyceae]ACA99018.1 FHA domain protein [Picosynechococcus sp. PCC 7002]SMH35743.1 FHA domain-containing protein [Picosynechococcus sp. OG1]SMQ84853.1 FHA domain-containing protein [Synechococcus sp. 7002]
MAKSIVTLVDNLPENNITTKVLTALDTLFPGEWINFRGFDDAIRQITQETNPEVLQRIRDKAIAFYDDPKNGYQSAVFLYQTVDRADAALGTAALADKIGEKIGLLGFLSKLTPKADTSQTIDLVLKISVEAIAYCKLNGLPQANPQVLAQALQENYRGAALVRMGTLVCVDGLLPLGPDFLEKVHSIIGQVDQTEVQNNSGYTVLGSALPGEDTASKLGFLSENFEAVRGWMQNWIAKTGVSRSSVFSQLGRFIEFADDNLDLVAAFLDQTTNYFTHTGIQTVATHLIKRAYQDVQTEMDLLPGTVAPPEPVPTDAGATTLQLPQPQFRHVQTDTVLAIPKVSIVHIGKPNPQYPPEVDLSPLPNSDVVSRLHANLWSDNGFEYYILDVGSSNGTYLNGVLLEPKEKHLLQNGDRLDFGRGEKVSLIFEMG